MFMLCFLGRATIYPKFMSEKRRAFETRDIFVFFMSSASVLTAMLSRLVTLVPRPSPGLSMAYFIGEAELSKPLV